MILLCNCSCGRSFSIYSTLHNIAQIMGMDRKTIEGVKLEEAEDNENGAVDAYRAMFAERGIIDATGSRVVRCQCGKEIDLCKLLKNQKQ